MHLDKITYVFLSKVRLASAHPNWAIDMLNTSRFMFFM
jgi:hypothetical protein